MNYDQFSPSRVGWLPLRAFRYILGKSSNPTSMISGHGVQRRAYAAANATDFHANSTLTGDAGRSREAPIIDAT